jgi:hypothetical protein
MVLVSSSTNSDSGREEGSSLTDRESFGVISQLPYDADQGRGDFFAPPHY